MQTYIVRLPPKALPAGGPSLVLVPTDAGNTSVTRYLQAAKQAGPLPAGKPLVAIIRSGPLSTPDQILVTESTRDGQVFKVTLEGRRFTGTLLANVVTVALIEVELGPLTRGTYEVVVTETTLHFQDIQHPENATNPAVTSQQLQFEVR